MCFKRISFLFPVQKKRLEVNVREKWNLLSIIVNIRKSRQYFLNENINDSLFIKWDKREGVLSDIAKTGLLSIGCFCPVGHKILFSVGWERLLQLLYLGFVGLYFQ